MNIVLIGFKASGKSTVAPQLAALRRLRHVDTDHALADLHQNKTGQRLDPRQIFSQLGEDGLRALEKNVLMDLALQDNQVVATGGGIVTAAANRKLLRMIGLCVFLDAPLPVLEQRLRNVSSPLFAQKSVADLHAERYPLYLETAHLRFPVRLGDSPARLCQALHDFIREVDFGR